MATAEYDALVSTMVGEQRYRRRLQLENAILRKAVDPHPPDGRGHYGYYQQGTDVEAIYAPQEERWQRDIDRILCFLPVDQGWDGIAVPQWWADAFGAGRSRWASDWGTVISMPLCPDHVPDVTAIDPDDIWDCFTRAGQNLVDAGLHRAVLRIGWESQGSWYNWSSIENPGTYKARFRDAVDALRSVTGQEFLTDWNIAGGKTVNTEALPEDHVDVISIDLYDSGALDDQLRWLDESWELATSLHKSWGVAEWGLWGAEDPAYMEQMTTYLDTHAHLHAAYFDVSSSSDHRLSLYPDSAAVYGAWAPGAD